MSDLFNKIFIVLLYLVVLIIIPILLDYLFNMTVQKNNIKKIKDLATKNSDKSIMIFNRDSIYCDGKKINGNILNVSKNVKDNSVIVILNSVLEYSENPSDIINEMKRISGGNLYVIGYDKNSSRGIFDYKLRKLLNKPYFLPGDEIKLDNINELQIKLQKLYSKILPYNYVVNTLNV